MSSRATTFAFSLGSIALWSYWIWLGVAVEDQRQSDGLQWMAAFFATPPFLLLLLPAFGLALAQRAYRLALNMAMLGFVIVALPLAIEFLN